MGTTALSKPMEAWKMSSSEMPCTRFCYCCQLGQMSVSRLGRQLTRGFLGVFCLYNLSKAQLCCRDEAIIKYRQAAEGVKCWGEGRFGQKQQKREHLLCVLAETKQRGNICRALLWLQMENKRAPKEENKTYFSAFAYLMGVCLLWSWDKEISNETWWNWWCPGKATSSCWSCQRRHEQRRKSRGGALRLRGIC